MKIHIYKDVSPISTSLHDGGAVVVFTDRNPQEVWKDHWQSIIDKPGSNFYDKTHKEIQNTELGDADLVYETDATEEQVLIFEDAGCC